MLGQHPIPLRFVLEKLNYKCRTPTQDRGSRKHVRAVNKSIVDSLLGDAIFGINNNAKKQTTVKKQLLQPAHLKGLSRVHRVPSIWSQHCLCCGEHPPQKAVIMVNESVEPTKKGCRKLSYSF